MKRYISFTNQIPTIVVLMILLSSCGLKETAQTSSESPDGSSTITVFGTKNFGDPWQTTIKINAFKQEQQVTTEIFAGSLNEENIEFNWVDNNHCIITIKQQDNTNRTFGVETTAQRISLREM